MHARARAHTHTLPTGMLLKKVFSPPATCKCSKSPAPLASVPGEKPRVFTFSMWWEGLDLRRDATGAVTCPSSVSPRPWNSQERDFPEERVEAGMRVGAKRGRSSPTLSVICAARAHSRSSMFDGGVDGWIGGFVHGWMHGWEAGWLDGRERGTEGGG